MPRSLPRPSGRSSSRAPPPQCLSAGEGLTPPRSSPHLPAPRPYRYQSAGRRGGCAKPVPPSPFREPTLEAVAPPSPGAHGAGSAGTGGGQPAETRLPPPGRPAGRGGRRGREPRRPSAPSSPLAERSGARREEFSQNGTAGKTVEIPIPGVVSQRPEEGSRGNGPARGGLGGKRERGRARDGAGREAAGARRAAGARGSSAGRGEAGRKERAKRAARPGRAAAGHSPGYQAAGARAGAAGPPTPAWSWKGGSLECAE